MHWLCEFMCDTVADVKTQFRSRHWSEGVSSLTPTFDCHVTAPLTDDDDVVPCAWTRSALEDLLEFVNASRIVLVLRGEGPQYSRDPATQEVLKDIAPVVKRLLTAFGDRFEIEKYVPRHSEYIHSFRPYWDPPTELARQRISDGVATFEQVMQVRMEDWIYPTVCN